MKKLLALLLTLCLVIGMVPLAASAEGTASQDENDVASITKDGATIYYDSLNEAVEAVTANEGVATEIKVLRDVTDAKGMSIASNKNIVIDFGGCTYTLTAPGAGSKGTETNGFQLLKDSTIVMKNGTINIDPSNLAAPSTNESKPIKRIIQSYADLTLENMTLNAAYQYGGEDYALSFNNGKTVIKGKTSIIVSNPDTIAFDVCKFASYPSASVTFDETFSGKVTGVILYDSNDASSHKLTIAENITGTFGEIAASESGKTAAETGISISGGNFTEPVNPEYCEEGKAPLVTEDGCTIANEADLKDKPKDENGVYYDTDAAKEKFEATVTTAKGTKGYDTLEKALEAAQNNDKITLLQDVTISGGAGDTQGILTIDKNITIDGQNHSITAENNVQTGSSMINIQNGANVTIKNVKIDSENTKHGLNTYTAPDATEKTTVTLENVEIKNGTGYGIVANNTVVNATNLTTSDNGWGGVNVDKGAQVTVGGASNLGEESSIVYENAKRDTNGEKGSLTVNGGTYKNIVVQAEDDGDEIVGKVSLTRGTFNGVVAKGKGTTNPTTIVDITGGKFAQTAAGDVGGEGAGEYVAIKDLIPEDYEISSDGTVKEEEPYVPPVIPTYKTTVEECEGGSVVASPSSAREGQKVTLTVKPQASQELKSLKVTDKDGDAVTLTKVEGGYTFNMPKGGVTVTAVFGCDGGAACPSKGFTDVDSEKWYHEYMDYAVEKGLLEGTSPTTMEPNATLTRAQLAQILYNLEGKPQVQGDLDFTDVAEGKWYYAAILWAYQEGVVDGMSPDTFAPNEDISRQDLALMLYRYAGEPTVTGDLDGFKDAGQVGDWAEEAITWAVEEGIIDGMTPTTLEPTGTATRAQAAAMLQRFLEG